MVQPESSGIYPNSALSRGEGLGAVPAGQMPVPDVAAAPLHDDQVFSAFYSPAAFFGHLGASIDRLGLGDETNPTLVRPVPPSA